MRTISAVLLAAFLCLVGGSAVQAQVVLSFGTPGWYSAHHYHHWHHHWYSSRSWVRMHHRRHH